MPVGPVPPERYRLTFAVPSLRLTQSGQVVRAAKTTVDMLLPAGYPRERPYLTTTEPVFHPNFGPHVCIADTWTPADSLVHLVVELAALLQYQQYSTKSPINRVAAQWAAQNPAHLPLGAARLTPADPEAAPTATLTGTPEGNERTLAAEAERTS